MAAIPVAEDVSIRMPSDAAAAAGAEVPRPRDGGDDDDDSGRAAAAANCRPEKQLTRFVRSVVLGEWAGNAFGTLALAWATTVLLGGFCVSLNTQDFWFATFMIFVESIRVFSRHYKSDSQYLFGSARALRWISSRSSFPRMLGRPQEGNQLVLMMGLCFNLIHKIEYFVPALEFILTMALLILWSRWPRRPRQWHMRAVAVAYLLFSAYTLFIRPVLPIALPQEQYYNKSRKTPWFVLLREMLPVIIEAGAVLLLLLNVRRSSRPGLAANLTTTTWGCRLISLGKVTSALRLAAELLAMACSTSMDDSIKTILSYCLYLNTPITLLVLTLGSLQNHHATHSLFGRCTDTILHILFLMHFVVPFPVFMVVIFVPGLSGSVAVGMSFVVVLLWLLIANLQIPTAVAQIILSSMRLSKLLSHDHIDYSPQIRDSNPNMVPALQVFYVLALCQGALYVMASFLGLFSSLPRRWLIQRSKIKGKMGEKAIDLYYHHAYVSRIEIGVFGARSMIMCFADFAIDSLSSSTSSSRDLRVAGLYVLHNILLEQRRDCSTQDLIHRVTSGSGIAVPTTLIGMLAWAADVEEDGYTIRLLASRVIDELASSLRISSIPGMLKSVSTLLKLADNGDAMVLVPNQQGQGHQQTPLGISNGGSVQFAQGNSTSNGGWRSLVLFRFWQRLKEDYWSTSEEPALSLTHQESSLPVLGMAILEKLARDIDNCAEILKDDTTNLISKTIEIIGYATTSDNEHNNTLVCSSLKFLRRLATTGERIGAALRHELWNHPFLLTSLARVLEDDRSSSRSPHQVWEPAMDIIAKLALDSAAGPEIGRNQVITASLLRAFLGRHGPTNVYYDQSLRKVSGEAMANLAMCGTANCLAILEEPGYHLISDLKDMLSDEDYRYVAASLLLNLCAHCSVKLLQCHPHAREHLSSALSTVMEHIMVAEGKQLESLINLAFEIGDVTREALVCVVESQTNTGAEFVQKLLCTLNSKKIPNPKYPRMRRVIVKILISILESCRRTVEKLIEEGMMERLIESLTKIERSPSRVKEYIVFYGNIGLVQEDGEPMSSLVAKAKALLV